MGSVSCFTGSRHWHVIHRVLKKNEQTPSVNTTHYQHFELEDSTYFRDSPLVFAPSGMTPVVMWPIRAMTNLYSYLGSLSYDVFQKKICRSLFCTLIFYRFVTMKKRKLTTIFKFVRQKPITIYCGL